MAESIALGMRLATATELATATGIEGEISVTEGEWRAVVHDGVTKGGHPVAKKSEVDAAQAAADEAKEMANGAVDAASEADVLEAANNVANVTVETTDIERLQTAIATVEANLGSRVTQTEESVDQKLGAIRYVIESWVSGTSWYRLYNDGWVDQGGRGGGTKTLPVGMKDKNYNISIAQNGAPDTWSTNITAPNSTTTITINTAYNTPHWRVKGFSSQ